MSKIGDKIIGDEEQGKLSYNDEKRLYEETRQILKGKVKKPLTEKHLKAVEIKHLNFLEKDYDCL